MYNSLFYIWVPSIFVFIAIWRSISLFKQSKINEGLYAFTLIGLLPWSLISAFRHMFLPGQIIKGQNPFFEFEAGGTSLAIAIASIYTLFFPNPYQYFIIFLIYLLYLIFALLAWLLYNKNTKLINIIRFISIILVMVYFVQIAHKNIHTNY